MSPGGNDPAAILIEDIERSVKLPMHLTGEESLAAVMCTLSQRIGGGEAADRAEAFPGRAQELVRRCPRHRAERVEPFGREAFLDRVSRHLRVNLTDAERITRGVFAVVRRWLPDQEVGGVSGQLPQELRELWNVDWIDPLGQQVLEAIRQSRVVPDWLKEGDALTAVLCTLSQRVARGEARHLYLELPPTLQPLVEACTPGREERPDVFHRTGFLNRVARELKLSTSQAEAITGVVFDAIQRVLPPREVKDIASQLPSDLKDLWMDTSVAADRQAAPS